MTLGQSTLHYHRLLAGLSEYAQSSKTAEVADDPRLIVFSTEMFQGSRRRVGGYVDRLKGALCTALLAVLLDRRFVIDWQTPLPIEHVLEPNGFDWRSGSERKHTLSKNAITIDAINNEMFFPFADAHLTDFSKTDLWIGQSGPIKLHTNITFIEYLTKNVSLLSRTRIGRSIMELSTQCDTTQLNNFILRALFDFLFIYKPVGAYTEMWGQFLRVRREGPVVGLHFRTGGEGKWEDPLIDDAANVEAVCKMLLGKVALFAAQNPKVFISSDSQRFKTQAEEIIGRTYGCVSFDVPISHFEQSVNVDVIDQTHSAVLEHMCLSYCDLLVHGHGGFGQYAGRMSGVSSSPYFE